MFNVLRRALGYASWHEWPEEFAMRKSDALTRLMNEKGRELADRAGDPVLLQRAVVRAASAIAASARSRSWAMWRSL